jgi:hypothetical protein
LAFQRQGDLDGVFDRFLVNHWEDTRHSGTDRADGYVGLCLGGIQDRASAEHLGLGLQFGVDFQANDGFEFGAH